MSAEQSVAIVPSWVGGDGQGTRFPVVVGIALAGVVAAAIVIVSRLGVRSRDRHERTAV